MTYLICPSVELQAILHVSDITQIYSSEMGIAITYFSCDGPETNPSGLQALLVFQECKFQAISFILLLNIVCE